MGASSPGQSWAQWPRLPQPKHLCSSRRGLLLGSLPRGGVRVLVGLGFAWAPPPGRRGPSAWTLRPISVVTGWFSSRAMRVSMSRGPCWHAYFRASGGSALVHRSSTSRARTGGPSPSSSQFAGQSGQAHDLGAGGLVPLIRPLVVSLGTGRQAIPIVGPYRRLELLVGPTLGSR